MNIYPIYTVGAEFGILRYVTKCASITVTKHGTISMILLVLETFIEAKANLMQNITYKRRRNIL